MSWLKVSKLIQDNNYEELSKYLKELPDSDKILQTSCREIALDELTFDTPWEKIVARATEIYDQTKAKISRYKNSF